MRHLLLLFYQCQLIYLTNLGGAFAADQRQLVLVNAKGVRAVTDRLILIVNGDLVFLDFVCKFIGLILSLQ